MKKIIPNGIKLVLSFRKEILTTTLIIHVTPTQIYIIAKHRRKKIKLRLQGKILVFRILLRKWELLFQQVLHTFKSLKSGNFLAQSTPSLIVISKRHFNWTEMFAEVAYQFARKKKSFRNDRLVSTQFTLVISINHNQWFHS